MESTERATVKFKKRTSKVNLGKRVIEALPCPPTINGKAQAEWTYDLKVPRLAIAVYSSGSRTWYWVGRLVNGPMIRFKIGPYPETTPFLARKMAAKISADVVEGGDPRTERRRKRNEETLGQLFQRYLENAKGRKKTWAEDEKMFARHCGQIKGRTVSTINSEEIEKLQSRVATKGKYASNRVLALLSTVFKFSKTGHNPCKEIPRYKEQSRERYLSPDELQRFFAALDSETDTVRHFFLMLLLTGVRKSNTRAMRFDQLDFVEAVWTIPETKNGSAQRVHLCPEALEILQERRESISTEYVFPPLRGSAPYIAQPSFVWKRITDRAGISDLRVHDLRRTLASYQVAGGTQMPVIAKTLGHKSLRATEVYARMDLGPVKDSVNRATTAMLLAGQPGIPEDFNPLSDNNLGGDTGK